MSYKFEILVVNTQNNRAYEIKLTKEEFASRKVYEKVAFALDIVEENILYITRNSPHATDMDALLREVIFETDVLYVHLKGECCTLQFYKQKIPYGFAYTESINGRVLIAEIDEQNMFQMNGYRNIVCVGSVIYKINGTLITSNQNFENALKSVKLGDYFTMEIYKPNMEKQYKNANEFGSAVPHNLHDEIGVRILSGILCHYFSVVCNNLALELWRSFKEVNFAPTAIKNKIQDEFRDLELPSKLVEQIIKQVDKISPTQ